VTPDLLLAALAGFGAGALVGLLAGWDWGYHHGHVDGESTRTGGAIVPHARLYDLLLERVRSARW
jgi:hypothetical protein